ncbi:hypothetical protein C8R43DRAFT_963858 [Mycena crocata]|nr:hypothetical protein C8R43DRAFT_963858 [Mycena crocata]
MSGTNTPTTNVRKLRSGTLSRSGVPQTLGNPSSRPASAAPGATQRAKSATARAAANATVQHGVPHSAEIASALDRLAAAGGDSPFLDPVGANVALAQAVAVPTPSSAVQSAAAAETATSSQAPTLEDFPPLPAPGKEVMTGSPPRSRPGSPPHTSTPPRSKDKGKKKAGNVCDHFEVLEDEHLGGFLPADMAAARDAQVQREADDLQDPVLQRKIEEAKQRSLTAMAPPADDNDDILIEDSRDLHLQSELEEAKRRSLASAGSPSNKSPCRLEEGEVSPPKRLRSTPPEASSSGANERDRREGPDVRVQAPSPLHPTSNPTVIRRFRHDYATVNNLPYGGDFGNIHDPGELPHIAGIMAEAMYQNIGPDQEAAWRELVRQKSAILCYPAGGGSGVDATDRTMMKTLISIRVNAPIDSFEMSPPNRTGERPAPYFWLLYDLPHFVLEGLLDIKCLSADGNGVFFSPLNPLVSPYLGCITGLTASTKEEAEAVVIEALKRPENRGFKSHVLTDRGDPYREMEADEVWDEYLSRIHASRIMLMDKDGALHLAWRIYAGATSNVTDHYLTTIALFYDIDFRSNFHGQGKVRGSMSCAICRSTDHPTNLCEWPLQPGWAGPTPASLGTLNHAASSGGTASGGGRGRGSRGGFGNTSRARGGRGGGSRGNPRGRGFAGNGAPGGRARGRGRGL